MDTQGWQLCRRHGGFHRSSGVTQKGRSPMMNDRFETLTTSFMRGSTRRRLLALLTAVPVVGMLTGLDEHEGAAKRRHRKRKGKGKGKGKIKKKVFSAQMSFTGLQSIPSGTQTTVKFNQIDHDQRSTLDLATSHFRAPFAGTYLVNARMVWNGNGTTGGQRQAFLVQNDTSIVAAAQGIPAGVGFISAPSTTATLGAGETLSLAGLQDSGAPVDVSSAYLSILLQRR
jgi:hypothetical protein